MPIAIALALSLSGEQRRGLEVMARSSSLPHRKVVQAKALLLAADGVANEQIARRCATTPDTVRRWRARFAQAGVDGVGAIAAQAVGATRGGRGDRGRHAAHASCRWVDALDDPVDG